MPGMLLATRHFSVTSGAAASVVSYLAGCIKVHRLAQLAKDECRGQPLVRMGQQREHVNVGVPPGNTDGPPAVRIPRRSSSQAVAQVETAQLLCQPPSPRGR